jgi:hypothetical protein
VTLLEIFVVTILVAMGHFVVVHRFRKSCLAEKSSLHRSGSSQADASSLSESSFRHARRLLGVGWTMAASTCIFCTPIDHTWDGWNVILRTPISWLYFPLLFTSGLVWAYIGNETHGTRSKEGSLEESRWPWRPSLWVPTFFLTNLAIVQSWFLMSFFICISRGGCHTLGGFPAGSSMLTALIQIGAHLVD